jgi:PhnB protein
MTFTVNKETNQIFIERSYDAPNDLVWAAYTESDILDQWWAPKPWAAKTKHMDFREGGSWLYAMVSPEGEEHWSKVEYITIRPKTNFSAVDGFCDADGNLNMSMPRNHWDNTFHAKGDQTTVNMVLSFETLADLEAIIQMGFKEGITMGMENLDAYIAAQFYLRKQNKPDNQPRVSFYLNFPGNTEEAFLFYRKVFKTEFVNGIKRLGEAPVGDDHPPMDENVKKMVLHVELPLIGGHVLMGTDAPKEFGFTVTSGNNMHINLEPESRDEADRLFNELSDGGKIDMPMQDMFFGAYYGAFADKYGVNWMVTHQNA